MNHRQLSRMRSDKGFIAALDQSGGSTPKALQIYGIDPSEYTNEDEMFDLVHAMRSRIITSPSFDKEHILGAILFEQTMDRDIDDKKTGEYLWSEKGIVPFLKVDKGLAEETDGVQLMKPIPGLNSLLDHAKEREIFGTKMRSVVKQANEAGIKEVVKQQFELGKQIADKGLVPILEPEVDIHCPEKKKAERILLEQIKQGLNNWDVNQPLMFKLTIPDEANLYAPLMEHSAVVRVVALSGGYSREEANERLADNHGLIASFSRALSEGLSVDQDDDTFNRIMADSVRTIYEASIT